MVLLRAATLDDAEPLRAIYNHYVAESVATFDLEQRTAQQQEAWMADRAGALAVLVAVATDEDGTEAQPTEVLGFASISPYKARAAYRTTVENSIYLAPGATGRGVGKSLMQELIAVATSHGFHAMIARVNTSLESSIGLHESVGFERVGVERQVGRKFGKWQDIQVLQRMLSNTP